MYEEKMLAYAKQDVAGLGCGTNPFENQTCGENLERKIKEHKQRLVSLEKALEEMKSTGLYTVRISTLRETMSY